MSAVEQAIKDIAADVEKYLSESLADPDMASRSQEFKDGYCLGFREAMTGSVVVMLKRAAEGRP